MEVGGGGEGRGGVCGVGDGGGGGVRGISLLFSAKLVE